MRSSEPRALAALHSPSVLVMVMLTLFIISSPARSQPPKGVPTGPCPALVAADLSALLDAPTEVRSAELVERVRDVPAHCRVRGYVMPNVGFTILLPASGWNHKFLEVGCGGYCGDVYIEQCMDAVRTGYTCIASDMGHSSTYYDGKWAYNNLQAKVDFGYRATHVTALAGKAITERFYAQPPEKAYYMGCSTGGRQGMVEAQRFPWDFDGIIAGSVNIGMEDELMELLWDSLQIRGSDGQYILNKKDLQLIHDAAVTKCDMDDNVKDGIIGNPRACQFDPAELLCTGERPTACLSARQIDAVRNIYAGPMTSKGVRISTGGPMPGSELSWIDWLLPSETSQAISPNDSMTEIFTREWFRYLAFVPDPGPAWKPTDFDFDREYKRFMNLESLYSDSNPDLRKFKQAGGKLIVWGGWNDPDATPRGIIDYYETAEKTMGGRQATQDFFRLFLVPGMSHCGMGEGPFAIDYLHYLEEWVEKGESPDVLIGRESIRHLFAQKSEIKPAPSAAKHTRPVYPFPAWTRYKGAGNPNDAASYEPVELH